MPKLVYLIVNRSVFFYISVCRRYICLGLVIIVVTYEIFNRVFWEELFKLAIKLSGKCFVVGYNKRWLLKVGYHISHSKGFSRACDTKQGLMPVPFYNPIAELAYGFRLVSTWRIFRNNFKLRHLKIQSPQA